MCTLHSLGSRRRISDAVARFFCVRALTPDAAVVVGGGWGALALIQQVGRDGASASGWGAQR